MILWIRESDTCYPYMLKYRQEKIMISNYALTVTKNNTQVYLRSVRNITLSKTVLNNEEVCEMHKGNNGIAQFLLLIEQNENIYRKYAMNDCILIGGEKHCDIVIPSLADVVLKIDTIQHLIISCREYPFISFNENAFLQDTTYQFLDVLCIHGLRMIFMDDGIMLRTLADEEIHLQEYVSHKKEMSFSPEKKIRVIQNHVPSYNNELHYDIPLQLEAVYPSHLRPFLLETGPALLMSSASLSAGLFAAYQSYMNGRDVYSLIPMILLPSVMLVSSLLFQPLNRMYDARQKKKITIQNQQKEQEWIDAYHMYYDSFASAYMKYMDMYFPSCTLLKYKIETKEDRYLHSIHDGIQLRFFDAKDVIHQNVDEKLKQTNDENLYPKINAFHTYHKIAIKDEGEMYLKYIFLQFIYLYDCPCIVYADAFWLKKHQWVRLVPNCLYHNQRMITSSFKEAKEFSECLKDKKFLTIIIDQKDLLESEAMIVFTKDIDTVQCDLAIDIENACAYDYLTKQQCSFTYDICELDMQYLLYHLQKDSWIIHQKEQDFFSIQNMERVTMHDIYERWHRNDINEGLLAVIGTDKNGEHILLDLNEKKDGPHGLVAGMTGSGKSELIITMLLSIALNYSYEDVNFALIDFKGGGTSNALKSLPHICGTLSNLDTKHTERALVSFQNECIERQKNIQIMNEKSIQPITDITSYRKHLFQFKDMPKMADLVIVVDEFAEVKRLQPDFLRDLVSIARIGRSLGIHLILCTQKPAGIINEEIWANCSFQIVLKVARNQDAHEVIREPFEMDCKKPGDFILYSTYQGLIHGRSAYASSKTKHANNRVDILHLNGSVQCTNDIEAESPCSEILQIFQTSIHESIKQLWKQPLEKLSYESAYLPFVFAKADDYYHRTYIDLYLYSTQKRNTVFLCPDLDARKNCLSTILHVLFVSMQKEELFVIDDLHFFEKQWQTIHPDWITLCDSTNTELIHNVFYYLKKQKKEKILLITDLSKFLQEDEQYSMLFHEILEHASMYEMHVITFVSSCDALRYRDLVFLENRYVLQSDTLPQIQQFLETGEKKICSTVNEGLCKMDHVLSFQLLETSVSKLVQLLKQSHANNKKTIIPCMPERIDRTQYKGGKIPLGISYTDYTWLTLMPTQSVYIVSIYKEEWIAYRKTMQMYAKCTTRKDSDEEDGQLIFLSLDEYRKKHAEDRDVLYVGTSFHQQYTFHSRYEVKHEYQAIYFHAYESNLVRIL